jgi:hypothetical protein
MGDTSPNRLRCRFTLRSRPCTVLAVCPLTWQSTRTSYRPALAGLLSAGHFYVRAHMDSAAHALALVVAAAGASSGGALAFWLAGVGARALSKFSGRETTLVRAAEFGASSVVLFLVFQSFLNPWVASMIDTWGLPLAAFGGAITLLFGGLVGAIAVIFLVLPVLLLLRLRSSRQDRSH